MPSAMMQGLPTDCVVEGILLCTEHGEGRLVSVAFVVLLKSHGL